MTAFLEAQIQDPSFWVAVAFVLFVALFGRALARRLAALLDARRDAIRAELAEARRLRDDAQEILNDHAGRRKRAEEEAGALLEASREEAKRVADEAAERLAAQLARARARARHEIARAEEAAVQDFRARLAGLVIEAAEELAAGRVDDEVQRELAERTVADAGRALERAGAG